MEKFFYLRSADIISNDDSQTDSVMIPISKIRGLEAPNDITVKIYFESPINDIGGSWLGDQMLQTNSIVLNIVQGTRRLVMKAIAQASNSGPHDDGIIVIADDITKTYVSKYIKSVDAFAVTMQIGGDVDNT